MTISMAELKRTLLELLKTDGEFRLAEELGIPYTRRCDHEPKTFSQRIHI